MSWRLDDFRKYSIRYHDEILYWFQDLCECHHNPPCSPPVDYIMLPGYHRADEFLVVNWPKECAELWQLVWSHNCQTMVLLGKCCC
ncbi:hypothetical protein COOONC_12913 [Cooperia oncophora]